MRKNFKDLIDALDKQWDAEIVPAYEKLKQRLLNTRALTKMETQGIIDELTAHYRKFLADTHNKFAPYRLDETERLELERFLNDIVQSLYTDSNEFISIYNLQAAQLKNYFFHQQAARLPMPSFEEQYMTQEIFPSDPETHPQYYTYDFK